MYTTFKYIFLKYDTDWLAMQFDSFKKVSSNISIIIQLSIRMAMRWHLCLVAVIIAMLTSFYLYLFEVLLAFRLFKY